jgi:tripartite-type tricarboxylate transporter receptor subunit TctC
MRDLGYDSPYGNYYFVIFPKAATNEVVRTLHHSFKQAMDTDHFKTCAQGDDAIIDYEGPTTLPRRLASEYGVFMRWSYAGTCRAKLALRT